MNVAEIVTMHEQSVVVMSRTFQKTSLIQSSVDVIDDRGVRCSDHQYKYFFENIGMEKDFFENKNIDKYI